MNASRATAERDAFRSVKRACASGLDSVSLRVEVARRTERLIPSEAYFFNTLDPETGLLTHVVGEGAPAQLARDFFEHLYPFCEAERTLDLARSGRVATTETSSEMATSMRAAGFGRELRAAFSLGEEPWGVWCSLREGTSRAFESRDVSFMRRIAPHVARGLRTAALLSRATAVEPDDAGGMPAPEPNVPGVIVIDPCGRVTQRTMTAAAQLIDLADVGSYASELPSAVLGVLALQRAAGRSGTREEAELRVRGRSGRWYTLRVALTEPDESGIASSIVMITPITRSAAAPLLARLYGLSPREREVAGLVARGYTAKEIAVRLGISTYTVQDHLDHASVKVGVRGRRALLARLFFDGYAQRVHP